MHICILVTLILGCLVQRLSLKNQEERSLCDKSMKFGGDVEKIMLNLFRMGTAQIWLHLVDYKHVKKISC